MDAANSVQDNVKASDQLIAERLQRYVAVKQDFIDFVLDAEGDIAIALEAFSAQQLGLWSKPNLSGLNRSELAIDMFLTEGEADGRSLIDLFIDEQAALSAADKDWIKRWSASFSGLFVVDSVDSGDLPHYTMTNWLTKKQYCACPVVSDSPELLARIAPGEIVLARLLPITADVWTLSGPFTLLGKLGKPKLAVAIGNFKKWFPTSLYGDAPELKEAAWESVAQQYDDFVELFGGKQVTLSGYELNKKFQAFQARSTEKKLADAGIDSSKSLKDIAADVGVSAEEISEAVGELGTEGIAAKKVLESTRSLKMVMPKVSLPDEYRNAKSVTVFVHPRWGQSMLTDYVQLEERLNTAGSTSEADESLDRMVVKYMEKPQVNAYVLQRIYEAHSDALNPSLCRVLNKPSFNIDQDLAGALAKHGKSLTPQMPDSASVPVHLHNLFQEALQAVGKGAKQKGEGSQGKKRKKKKSGFGG